MRKYQIKKGKVQTRSLEVHILNHCNLSCDHCCSFSPLLKKREVSPQQVQTDLGLVKSFLAPQYVKIVGGEPTLHSEFDNVLEVIKKSNVAPIINLTTNGHFLKSLTDKAWDLLDMITFSVYPTRTYSNEDLKLISKKAKENKVTMNWKVQDQFVQMNREELADYETTKETFQNCWIHHRCHSVRDGFFYCCTRTQYLKALYGPMPFSEDGIKLPENPPADFASTIKSYLERTEPLKSCQLCKGGQAQTYPQQQLSPLEKRLSQQKVGSLCQSIK